MSVKVENLRFAYGQHEVLSDVSFDVPEGTLVNVLGPNGTGSLCGLRRPRVLAPQF